MYLVKYAESQFGFIKPFTSVRDEVTFSQTFLTTSILIGMEFATFDTDYKLTGRPNRICRHKLSYKSFSLQQEVVSCERQNIHFSTSKDGKINIKGTSTLERGVLLYPELNLCFESFEDAQIAFESTIKLTRNEDIMFPVDIIKLTEEEFEQIPGIEFFPKEEGILVGYNRFDNFKPMYGEIKHTYK